MFWALDTCLALVSGGMSMSLTLCRLILSEVEGWGGASRERGASSFDFAQDEHLGDDERLKDRSLSTPKKGKPQPGLGWGP